MKEKEVMRMIMMGCYAPSSSFKRSVWVRIERVMEFLANKGEIKRVNGEVKYETPDGRLHDTDLRRWTDMYVNSPLNEHIDELIALAREMHLPVNSGEVLKAFMNTKID